MRFISVYSVLNTLLEYTYFYISKNITSYTFLLVFKIFESLRSILKIQWCKLYNYKYMIASTQIKNTEIFAFIAVLHWLTSILRPIPSTQLSMLLASIWDSFLAQASVLLLCQYPAALSRRKGPDLFLQSGPFQNFCKFFQESTWSQ